MSSEMSTELMYLTWVTALTAVLWIPYILNMIAVRGLLDAVGYPENPAPMAEWAQRMKAAHVNAVENLVVFATLVLVAHGLGVSNDATVLACQIYFWARVVHVTAYTFRIPWVRTLAFVAGFAAQLMLVLELL
ncbi:MAG: MAPEG family protein [Woeseiaceae bacterium]|nr:MAPEG family protein [Woeseiaceae bacterium]